MLGFLKSTASAVPRKMRRRRVSLAFFLASLVLFHGALTTLWSAASRGFSLPGRIEERLFDLMIWPWYLLSRPFADLLLAAGMMESWYYPTTTALGLLTVLYAFLAYAVGLVTARLCSGIFRRLRAVGR